MHLTMTQMPPSSPSFARLSDRAVLAVTGPDAASFLQRILSQNVEGMTAGDLRLGLLLTPQGRVMHDLMLWRTDDGFEIETTADRRDDLLKRLMLYKLRADVTITPQPDRHVVAHWNRDTAPDGEQVARDPRLGALGWRQLITAPSDPGDLAAYRQHQMALGVPDLGADLADQPYPLDANLDLLQAIDFHKGCFVGQEVTSRMKRKATLKTRSFACRVTGPTPKVGADIDNAQDLRSGVVTSVLPGWAMTRLRLDRMQDGPLRAGDSQLVPVVPDWLRPHLPTAEIEP